MKKARFIRISGRIAALAMVLCMMLCVTAFAAKEVNAPEEAASGDSITVEVTGAKKGEYITVLVYDETTENRSSLEDEEILYVNQKKSDENGTSIFVFPINGAGGDVKIAAIGGKSSESVLTTNVTIKKGTYEITFKDYDGSVLSTVNVEEGAIPQYDKADPTREESEGYSYAFSGWDKALTAATANAIYTATYTRTASVYTITYNNTYGASDTEWTKSYTVEDAVTLPVPSSTGLSFIKWYANEELTDEAANIEVGTFGNKTYYAKWKYNTPEISVSDGKLTGFVGGGSYTVNGVAVKPSGGILPIADEWYGDKITIIRSSSTASIMSSGEQQLSIPHGDIPTVIADSVTYTDNLTLADIALPSVKGGTLAWKDGTIHPNAETREYEAVFTQKDGTKENVNISVTVTPAKITGVTVTGYNGRYDGAEHKVSVEGARESDTLVYKTGSETEFSSNEPKFTEIGVYTVIVKISRPNYADLELSATISITEKDPVPVSVTPYGGDDGAVYDGEAHNAVTVNDVLSSDVVTYKLDDGEETSVMPTVANAGTYKVYVKVERPEFDAYITTVTVTIKPAQITGVTAEGYTGEADGEAHGITVNGTINGDVLTYKVDGGEFTSDVPSFTNVGTYTVTVKVSRTNYNDLVLAPVTVTLTQADNSLEVLDSFKDILSIEKSCGTDGVTLTATAVDGKPLPKLVLYKAVYSGNTLTKLSSVPFEAVNGEYRATMAKPEITGGETFKLMLWTSDCEPVISVIDNTDTTFFK